MKCERIRQHLSGYMDKALDASVRTEVERHLSECKACKEELDSLKSLVGELGAMDIVKAPADFLESVHKRMESRFALGRLVRRIFVPVRIKVPLEFAAVAATAVLVFIIFNAQQQKMHVPHAPESRSQQALSDKKAPVRALKSMPSQDEILSAEVREEVPGTPSAAPHEPMAMAGRSEKEAVKPMQEDKGLALMPSNEALKKSRKERETRVIELTLILPTDTRRGVYPTQETAGKALTLSESDEIGGGIDGTPKEGVSNGEAKAVKKEKHVDTFAYGERSSNQAFSQVEGLIEDMGGRVISTMHDKETQRLQSLQAEIPAENYTIFIERLKILALLQTAPPSISDIDGEYFQAHIRFLAPE